MIKSAFSHLILAGIFSFCLFFLSTDTVYSQEILQIPKLDQPLVFDGKLDEAFWAGLEPLELTMYTPVYLGEKTEKEEMYLVYDDKYIYLAAKLYYTNPADIRSNSLYRDEYRGDDVLAVILDSFNDNETAVRFFTNPDGNRYDGFISGDTKNHTYNWDSYWDVKTVREDWGWSAEMRIPFSSLGFQSKNGTVTMGAIVYRFAAKKNERYVFPAISPDNLNGFRKPSLARKVQFHGIKSETPVYFTPYLLGGIKQTTVPHNPAAREWTKEAGLDVKLNVSENLTLDLTANTDFAQVEADNQQINLTRFPLFFPEKRQFFQERSDIFDFAFARSSRLFHSRRIGLSADGEPIRIYGGIRAVGSYGKTDIGLINMQTEAANDKPSENFNVLRLRRHAINKYSTIGAMFTSRIGNYGNSGSNNYAYGADANIRVFGDDYLTLKAAQTIDERSPDIIDNSLIHFRWERITHHGFKYTFRYEHSGKDFNPRIGFIQRQDFSVYDNRLEYTWTLNKSSVFQNITLSNLTSAYTRNTDRNFESAEISPHLEILAKGGSTFKIQGYYLYENLVKAFSISKREDGTDRVFVPAGEYDFRQIEFRFVSHKGWIFSPDISWKMGEFFDGTESTLNFNFKWSVSSHLDVANEYEYHNIRFNRRNQDFDNHIVRLRLRAALNTKISITAFTQYNSDADNIGVNARFRYNFGQGDDFWIVYDNILETEPNRYGFPQIRYSGYQALMVKFTKTLKY